MTTAAPLLSSITPQVPRTTVYREHIQDVHGTPQASTVLSSAEQQDLDRLEGVIDRGLRTFIEVGEALARIRDGRLYRRGYPTFEDYTSSRWGFGRRRADQLINAGAVGTFVLTAIPDALTRHGLNEAHARELNGLEPNQAVAV